MELDSDDDEASWIESWMEDEGLHDNDDDNNNVSSGYVLDSDDDPDPEPEPEPELEPSTSNYCQTCEKYYKNERSLKRHLETAKVHATQRDPSKRFCNRTKPQVPNVNIER